MRARAVVVAALVAAAVLDQGSALAEDPTSDWAASHFRVENPAHLDDAAAERIYGELADDMVALYRLSREPYAAEYLRWPRYVSAPYRTATHGERYHNIYARSPGRAYGRYEHAGEMAPGTVVVKDSFSVSSDGRVDPGPLSVMVKLEPGASPGSGDWRFTEIMPDGSLFGSSDGPLAANVAHCVACHRAVAASQDWLYFPPLAHRVN